jgi:hypothetical protein
MTFDDMKKAVGRRSSDPNATRYSDAIEDYLIQAMSNILLSEGIIEEQAPLLIAELTRNVPLENGLGVIEINNANFPSILRVIKPFINPVSNRKIILTEDSIKKFNYRKDNPVLQPDTNEGFWTKDGSFIRFYFDSKSVETTIDVIFRVINNPVPETISSSRDLVNDGYGLQFLYSVIDLASVNLRNQIGME